MGHLKIARYVKVLDVKVKTDSTCQCIILDFIFQAVKSYDTKLLLRLHRIQRALKNQESNNGKLTKDLQNLGVGKTGNFDNSLLPLNEHSK